MMDKMERTMGSWPGNGDRVVNSGENRTWLLCREPPETSRPCRGENLLAGRTLTGTCRHCDRRVRSVRMAASDRGGQISKGTLVVVLSLGQMGTGQLVPWGTGKRIMGGDCGRSGKIRCAVWAAEVEAERIWPRPDSLSFQSEKALTGSGLSAR